MAIMDKPMPGLSLKMMSCFFIVRDLFHPRRQVLKEVNIKPGDAVLDYGCDPGAYIAGIEELVGGIRENICS